MKKRKFKITYKTVAGIVCAFGFLYLLGSVGSMETRAMTFSEGVRNSMIGLILFAGGGLVGGFFEWG